MFKILFLILVLTASEATSQTFTLSGTVRDASNGTTLPGVNIFIPQKQAGTVTDDEGFYSLRLPQGNYKAIVSFIGYRNIERNIMLYQNISWDVNLETEGVRLQEVVVAAEARNKNVEQTDMSTLSLNIETIRNMPAFLGEVDVLRSIQLLPGVQSAGDGNTGFFVRGGDADQNLVLLDDAIIYNASHLFNFFSVFNPDAIKDITLYKGGIPPDYGGRLASVLDVRTNEGNNREYKFNGGIGLISSRFTIQGPVQYNRSSFLVSARRTYADLFLKLSPDETQRDTKLFFYDLNGKFNYIINNRNRIYFSGYHGKDITAFSDLFGFDWGNSAAVLRWNHLFSDSFISDISLIHSNYQFNISGDIGLASFRWNSQLNDLGIKANFQYFHNNQNQYSFGLQSIYHHLDPGLIRGEIEGAALNEFRLSTTQALEHGIYFNNEHRLIDNLLAVNYGLRFSVFQLLGPLRQYNYDQSDPLRWAVTDTISIPSGEIYETFSGLEPRINLRLMISESTSIKGSYNRMIQYIKQAQSAQSVAPYDVWFTVGNNIPPQIADQYAVGIFQNFYNNQLETSLEFYFKDMKNITDIIDNGDILGNELLDSQLRTGKGWSYGAELMISMEHERFNGFVGYTLALTKRRIQDINEGRPYFAPNDRRNDISLSGVYNITSHWNLGVNFTYASGQAFTLPIGRMYFEGSFAPIFAERNTGRLPDYHRLDLSITYSSPRNENRRFQHSWNFSFFNVYGRVNPISVSFAEKADNLGVPATSFFYIPGPIPAITWNFNF